MSFSTKAKYLSVGFLSQNSQKLFFLVGMLLILSGTVIMTGYDCIVWIVNINKITLYSMDNGYCQCLAHFLQQTLILYMVSFTRHIKSCFLNVSGFYWKHLCSRFWLTTKSFSALCKVIRREQGVSDARSISPKSQMGVSG